MAITQYKTLAAALTGELDVLAADAIADGWQPVLGPYLGRGGMHVQAFVKGTPSEGGGGEVTAADITDATTVGRDVLTAANAAAARAAIGAGTSNLAIGTTASTAKAGNYTPPNAATGTRGLVLMGAAVADAGDETEVVAQFNALLAALRASGALDSA